MYTEAQLQLIPIYDIKRINRLLMYTGIPINQIKRITTLVVCKMRPRILIGEFRGIPRIADYSHKKISYVKHWHKYY